jgi:hypothetical protein
MRCLVAASQTARIHTAPCCMRSLDASLSVSGVLRAGDISTIACSAFFTPSLCWSNNVISIHRSVLALARPYLSLLSSASPPPHTLKYLPTLAPHLCSPLPSTASPVHRIDQSPKHHRPSCAASTRTETEAKHQYQLRGLTGTRPSPCAGTLAPLLASPGQVDGKRVWDGGWVQGLV